MENLTDILSAVAGHQVTHFTFAFTMAAWLHSHQVKKEISNQFQKIVMSIDNVAKALKNDLDAQTHRLNQLETGVLVLAKRVDNLEGRASGNAK